VPLPANLANGTAYGTVLAVKPLRGIRGIFQSLAECSQTAHLVQFFDSNDRRAQVSPPWAKGAASPAFGRRAAVSRPKSTSRPIRRQPSRLPPDRCEASDSNTVETVARHRPRYPPAHCDADKGYDSQANRAAALARRHHTGYPAAAKNSKQDDVFFRRRLYKLRARIEQSIGKLKRFKRVAMRARQTTSATQPSSVCLRA